MTPPSSLFDLTSVRYADGRVVLRGHRRRTPHAGRWRTPWARARAVRASRARARSACRITRPLEAPENLSRRTIREHRSRAGSLRGGERKDASINPENPYSSAGSRNPAPFSGRPERTAFRSSQCPALGRGRRNRPMLQSAPPYHRRCGYRTRLSQCPASARRARSLPPLSWTCKARTRSIGSAGLPTDAPAGGDAACSPRDLFAPSWRVD